MKEFADNNVKSDANGRQFSKQVKNTVGKREIVRYEQFLLFPQFFQRTYTADMLKTRACLEGLKKIKKEMGTWQLFI